MVQSNIFDIDNKLQSTFENLQNSHTDWNEIKHDKRRNVHAIFQYPAMMVPVVQERIVQVIIESNPKITNIFDPYVGAGTTLTTAMSQGLNCFGQDINPLAVLVSKVKTGPFFLNALADHIETVMSLARCDRINSIEADFPNIEKWFKPEVTVELSRLRRAIRSIPYLYARRFMWVVLAETVRVTSNDRTSTYKLHARSVSAIQERQISPLEKFHELAQVALQDLRSFKHLLDQQDRLSKGRYTNKVQIKIGNTAEAVNYSDKSISLITTSPPYGDNGTTITYGQHSYLPLQWIDLEDIDRSADKSFLRTTQEIDRRSLGGYSSRDLSNLVNTLQEKSQTLAETFDLLKDKPKDRTVRVASFFRDFDKSLDNIIPVLLPNGYMIWTIGNRRVGGVEIRNDRILRDLLEARDIKYIAKVSRHIKSKRMPYRNQTTKLMSVEQILIFRRSI